MEHACKKETDIATLHSKVEALENYTADDKTWKNRMEDKIDKILWFFLGQSVGLIICVIGGVLVYVTTTS